MFSEGASFAGPGELHMAPFTHVSAYKCAGAGLRGTTGWLAMV